MLDSLPRAHVADDLPPDDQVAVRGAAEIGEHERGRLETASAVVDRHPDAVCPEADDIRTTVAVDVGQEPGMILDAPTLVEAELGEDELGWREGAVAVAQRDPHPAVAEAQQVGM